jgi:hypothetical protein
MRRLSCNLVGVIGRKPRPPRSQLYSRPPERARSARHRGNAVCFRRAQYDPGTSGRFRGTGCSVAARDHRLPHLRAGRLCAHSDEDRPLTGKGRVSGGCAYMYSRNRFVSSHPPGQYVACNRHMHFGARPHSANGVWVLAGTVTGIVSLVIVSGVIVAFAFAAWLAISAIFLKRPHHYPLTQISRSK